MKHLILLVIKIYWKTIPPAKRGKCIYRESCSHYVFEQAQNAGLFKGLKALISRMKTCNRYFHLYLNPITLQTEILLSNGEVLSQDEIAERLIKTPNDRVLD